MYNVPQLRAYGVVHTLCTSTTSFGCNLERPTSAAPALNLSPTSSRLKFHIPLESWCSNRPRCTPRLSSRFNFSCTVNDSHPLLAFDYTLPASLTITSAAGPCIDAPSPLAVTNRALHSISSNNNAQVRQRCRATDGRIYPPQLHPI